MPENLWDMQAAQENPALDGLVYRSNLLGRDRSVVNIYGGNTSAKLTERDHIGRPLEVLWVKGSGSDLASITEQGFAGLRQAEVAPLISRESMSDEEMVAYLSHCTHALERPRQSIETLLHAFTPAKHVDHTHPDVVISLACSAQGREFCQRLWGARALWVDYIRPGFTLSKWIGEGLLAHPEAELVVMGKHGLLTWGDTSQACYASTIRIIQEAEDFIRGRSEGRQIFAGVGVPRVPEAQRQELLARVLPILRGALSRQRPAILQFDSSPAVLDFAGSAGALELSQVGAACPDHLVHTKRQPLFIDWQPAEGGEALATKLVAGVETFAAHYKEYFQQFSQPGDRMGDPYPRIILIPGLGMVTSGADAQGAAVAAQLYQRAISVMAGSQALDRFTSLTPEESYQIEYWPLELYKLSLKPAPRELAGRVAVITGGASGIGRATALRLAQGGAHVVILDLRQENAQAVADELNSRYGSRRGMALACDVTDEAAVARAFEQSIRSYGGVDIVVSCAGIALSAPVEQTSLSDCSLWMCWPKATSWLAAKPSACGKRSRWAAA